MIKHRSEAESQPSRRREILEVALVVFQERGYEASSIEDIRVRAGASVGSIYHHFGSKAGIASALYAEGLAEFQNGLLEQMRGTRSARGLVHRVVRFHLDWAVANPGWADYLLRMRRAEAVAAIEIGLRKMNAGFLEQALEIIEPHMYRGEIARVPADILVSQLFGPAHEFLRLWLDGRALVKIRQARKLLAEAAWKSVQPSSPKLKLRDTSRPRPVDAKTAK